MILIHQTQYPLESKSKKYYTTSILGHGWQHPRFRYYALWSWGGPALITGVTVLMQYLPTSLTDGYQLPEIGRCTCVFGQEGAIYYMHIVIAPMLVFNLVLFSFSSWSLCCGVWAADKKGILNKARKVYLGFRKIYSCLIYISYI